MQKDKRQEIVDQKVKEMLDCEEELPSVLKTDECFFEDVPDITEEEAEILREASHKALKKFLGKE